MDMPDALMEPRMHDQLLPAVTTFEDGFDGEVVQSMRERGHNVTMVRRGVSAVQGVRRLWEGEWEAASEPRQRNSGGLAT
jgi:gamma-glutamyltranspeptidase / glutathione hydrolase